MKTCSDCPSSISDYSKTGRCRPCSFARLRADPEWQKKRITALTKRMTGKDYRSRASARQAKRFRDNPDFAVRFQEASQAKWRERGKHHPAWHSPEVKAKRRASWMRTVYSWCPERLIPEYRILVRSKGIRAAEARKMIEDQITPFERQLLKVRNGAGIVELRGYRSPAAFSATGISTIYECG